jgi:hypothetical protein
MVMLYKYYDNEIKFHKKIREEENIFQGSS